MRNKLYLLVLLLVLSGCSNWKYGGKVRPTGNEVRYSEVVIEKNSVEPLVFDLPRSTSQDLAMLELPESSSRELAVKLESSLEQKNTKDIFWVPFQDKVVAHDDSLKKQEEVLAQALKTDREAKKGMIFGIIGSALSWTPAFIVGLIFSINGLKKSVRALKAPYITPKGLKSAKTGLILSIIGLTIATILVLTLFLLLLLLISGF